MKKLEASPQTPRSEDPFSERLHRLVENHYWKKILKLKKRDNHYSLSEYCSEHDTNKILVPRKELVGKLKKLGNQIKEATQEAHDHRAHMLAEIVQRSKEIYELGGTTEKENVKCLKNAEASKMKFSQLRKYKHPANPSTTTIQVMAGPHNICFMWYELKDKRVKTSTVRWEKVNDREEVSQHMLDWCMKYFGQSMDTLLATGVWEGRLDPK